MPFLYWDVIDLRAENAEGMLTIILEYVRSFRRKVLRTLYIQRSICSKQEYFFFREYSTAMTAVCRLAMDSQSPQIWTNLI